MREQQTLPISPESTRGESPLPPRPKDSGYNDPGRWDSPETRKPSEKALQEFLKDYTDETVTGTIPSEDEAVLLARKPWWIHWIRPLFFIGALLICILALILYTAFLEGLQRVADLPVALALPYWVLLGLVATILLYAGIRLGIIMLKLRARPQYKIKLIRAREQERDLSAGDLKKIRIDIHRYLDDLMRTESGKISQWRELWPRKPSSGTPTPEEIYATIKRLRSAEGMETFALLDQLERDVVHPLDKIANHRIQFYAKVVALKTAISPFPLVDAAAVLYNNALLMGDLGQLYQRRPTKGQCVLLLALAIFQTYIATQAQELAEGSVEVLGEGMSTGLIGKIAPKIAEGGVNAIVTWRLGVKGKNFFTPIKK